MGGIMDLIQSMENLRSVQATQNLKEASQLLFIEQSTLSKRIRGIESHFNAQLVNKDEGPNRLTPSGELVCAASIEIQDLITELELELEHLSTGTIATTTEHYLRTSLVHLDYDRLYVENNIDQLIKTYNESTISCLIIEELYEDLIEFQKKVIFSEDKIMVITSDKLPDNAIDLAKLNEYDILLHSHASYSQSMLKYIKKMQKEGELDPDLSISYVSNMQVLLVDLLLNPHKIFIYTPGIIIPSYLNDKLNITKIAGNDGTLKTYKYFK